MEHKPIWFKPAIKKDDGVCNTPCLCCAEISEMLPLDIVLYNGFGGWSIRKNGLPFFQEEMNKEFEDCKTLQYIEDLIGDNTEDEFIADLWNPLRGAIYQRHAKDNWVLIETNDGFA